MISNVTFENRTHKVNVKVSGGVVAVELPVADKLKYPRAIRLAGDVTGETLFDGSEDVQIQTLVSTLTNEELEEMLV